MKLSSIHWNNIITSIKFVLVIPPALCARKWRKNIWLITERSTQARDNGYCFFQYLKQEPRSCEAYYIIDKKSEDYQKIKKYGDIIQFDSWKHYFYYCLSQIHISAHVGGCVPSNSPICRRIKKLLGIKDVFLPHGVSYGVSEFCLAKYAKIDLFICSGRPEYDNVLQNYGYNKNQVAYTGFPRLDNWHQKQIIPNQIVLMPTWRLYLAQNEATVFEETEFFKAYRALIQSSELARFLTENGLHFVFYLHNEMRKYVMYFSTSCKNIEVVYRDDVYDIQELLKSAALLITDYSSVHFDFAYMKKPVIYYQFDQKEFFQKQYQKSFFDAEKNGFGPVVYDTDGVVRALTDAYREGFQMEQKYYDRMRSFYQIYDAKNCERVYQTICEWLVMKNAHK